jgi:hypothetical protein
MNDKTISKKYNSKKEVVNPKKKNKQKNYIKRIKIK